MLRITRVAAVIAAAAFIVAGASSASAAPAAKAKAKTHSVAGTLEKVDGHNLTVKTKKGDETLMLASNAVVRRGRKTISATDLSSSTGSHVTVRYTEQNGHMEAHSVVLSSVKKRS